MGLRTLLPTTADRVPRDTASPAEIERRLDELSREWDIERAIEANAASLALIGLVLGAFVDIWFLLVPAAVGTFLLQHRLALLAAARHRRISRRLR